ncbi:hypothetical protein WJX75_008347 [Coccomyxa subellipsoidea]|uniref:Exonuclease 1 n=1 Tax=Coccomyxa subellipsoidea TaxID=248742 RepID=A0ABR2Z5G6_9CHLO
MGIQGLLPLLKSITKAQAHVRRYAGQRAAVDAYGWLHKAAYCCAYELCEGIYTDRFVAYCMQRVETLQQAGVSPIIIFDGGRLPMKASEEGSRARKRKENLEKARGHWQAGNTTAAYESYQRAVDISPATAKQFIEALKAANVEYIVAPYEADAQMAYLAINGIVHVVITEDSDMLAYGCPRVFFKMDKNGEGQEVCMADLPECRNPSFIGFTPDMFLEMCILAGCDFLNALSSIGIKKAHGHIRKYKTFIRVCKSLRFSGVKVPREYESEFQRALWTFRHQRVYCPTAHAMVHLRPLPPGGLADGVLVLAALPSKEEADLPFLGPMLPDAVAEAIAVGDLDPITKEPFPELQYVPRSMPLSNSVQDDPFRTDNRRKQHRRRSAGTRRTLPVHANGIANYFKVLPVSRETQREFAAPRMFPDKSRLEHIDSRDLFDQSASEAECGTPADEATQQSDAGPDETPAERASSHGVACSSQPELGMATGRMLNLSRFSCGAAAHASHQSISIPARIGRRRPMTPMDDPLAAPASMPARRACGAGGRSPVLPASSDITLDFTTPQDTAATRANTAGTEPPPVMYITEKHIVFSELPDRSRQGHFTATDDADAASWQLLGLERAGQEAHVPDWDGADRCWRTGAGEVSEGCHTIAAVASVLSGLQQDSQAELEGALQNAWDEAADGLATEAELEEDLLSPIHRHPLALDGCSHGPAHKHGLSRRIAAGKRDGGCSVLQELSNEANQQAADLERLLTPPRGARSCAEPAALDEEADDCQDNAEPDASHHRSEHRQYFSPSGRSHSVNVAEREQRAEQPSECSEEEEEEEGAAATEGDAFHSLDHMNRFAREATKALDKVEGAARKGSHRRRGSSVAPHSGMDLNKPFAPPRAQKVREQKHIKSARGPFDKFACAPKIRGK